MSKNYEQVLLKKLLSKYEKSKLSTIGSNKNLKIALKLNEKNLPEYVNEDSYLYEKEINNTIYNLSNKNFIEYTINNGRIDKILLNLETIENIYNYLKLDSPKIEREKYLGIATKYKDKGYLTSTFATNVENIINNYKQHNKYFTSPKELEEIFLILDKLDNQKEEISRRTFSSKYLNDSKRLETILSKIEKIIKECTNIDTEDILSNYNVYKNPTFIYLKGSITIKINNQIIDLNKLSHELILSSNHLKDLELINLSVDNIITVENLTTFYDYPINNNLIIYLGGYHNEIRKNFLLKLFNFNKDLNFYHSGDIDAGGFYILNHLIKDTNINFIAKYMDINTLIKYKDYTKELTKEDIKRLTSLKEQPIMNKYLDVIEYMLKYNVKLEQENINYQ